MPLFMTRVSYTAESWKAQIANPQNREAQLKAVAEKKGGKILGFYYVFGDYDVVVIQDSADAITAASILIAVAGSGAIAKSETNLLMSSADGLEAIRRASESGYTPPGN